MALLEHVAQRFAEALDDYDHLTVTDIGGAEASGYWVVVQDGLSDRRCEISSRFDYWEFIARHAVGRPADAAGVGGAIGRPSDAAISAAEVTA